MFLDFLTDDDGNEYEYGHCAYDDDDGNESGCGMEYAYYADAERLDYWHDAVGLVSTRNGFTSADRDALDAEHAAHESISRPA